MKTQRTTVTPVPMSSADGIRVVVLALMSLTTVVGAAISPDLVGGVGFVLAAIAFGAAALWTPWQRRHGVAPEPPAAPTTTAAQRRARNVTLVALAALTLVIQITVQPTYVFLIVMGWIAVEMSSAVEKRWPKGNEH